MAAPPEISLKNLTGTFIMNKTLSDDPDKFFTLQGLSWLTRTAISYATVVLTIKEYELESTYHIDITSIASGLSTTQENRTLDWTDRHHQDRIFGSVLGRSRLFKRGQLEAMLDANEEELEFLRGEKLKDGSSSTFVVDDLLQSIANNQDEGYKWSVEQVWGFEEIDGKRYYTRRLLCKKGEEKERIRLVYDYTGAVGETKPEEDDLAYGDD